MRRRILTRLLWMVPALFVVSLLVFFINASGNQQGNFMDTQSENISSGDFSQQKIKNQIPVFYFSITSLSEPDTIWKMTDEEKELLQKNLHGKNLFRSFISMATINIIAGCSVTTAMEKIIKEF